MARSIEALSATYRAGRHDLDFDSACGRAAYAWHHLPAHVCDQARLLADVPEVLEDRESLTLLSVGAGPGTDVLALLEAVTSARARGELGALRAIAAHRLERVAAWDTSFQALLPPLLEQLSARDPGLTLDLPPRATSWDLTAGGLAQPPAPADLIVAANVLTELAPRGTDVLPGESAAAWRSLLEAQPDRTDLLLLDRAGAPGAKGRLEAVIEIARAVDPGAQVVGPRERTTRCGCALTRRAKEIYHHVNLPTTREEDRPVRNCKTVWAWVRLVQCRS